MSKRVNSSNDNHPVKRTRRPTGFRTARPPPTQSISTVAAESTTPLPPSNNSVFVTVGQPEEPRGALKRITRVLQPESLQQEHSNLAELVEHEDLVSPGGGMESDSEDRPSIGKKRKRYTRNIVSNYFVIHL